MEFLEKHSDVKKILVNGINLSGAGAQGIAASLLPLLPTLDGHSLYFLLLDDNDRLRSLSFPQNAQVTFVKHRGVGRNDADRVLELFLRIPRYAREHNVDLCLTLGDLAPFGLRCPQVVFFHQALLVYQKSELAGNRGWSDAKYAFLSNYFRLMSRSVNRFIVQTPVMADRLQRVYAIPRDRIVVMGQPVPSQVYAGAIALHPTISSSKKPIRLLFLAAYYPHKNHSILPGVLEEIRRRNLDHRIQIYTTIDRAKLKSSPLRRVYIMHPDVITNLGPLSPSEVRGALAASSAFFLPSLAESYGLTYLEALTCHVPILTSDLDFAHWMCRDHAIYFNPFSARSVVDAILRLEEGNRRQSEASIDDYLDSFPRDWTEVNARVRDVLSECS